LGKGWEELCGDFGGFFSGFGDDRAAARSEANQSGTFMVRIGDKFHEPLLLEAIDQDLNVLARAEAGASDLGYGLRTVALEKLKSSAAGTWKCCSRIGLQAIGQSIDFYKQRFETVLKNGCVRCYRGIHNDNMMTTAKYCQ
jgi:hypothetical protein